MLINLGSPLRKQNLPVQPEFICLEPNFIRVRRDLTRKNLGQGRSCVVAQKINDDGLRLSFYRLA
jgi:hypothetical protein